MGLVYVVTVVKALLLDGLFFTQVSLGTTFDKGPTGLGMQGWLVLIAHNQTAFY